MGATSDVKNWSINALRSEPKGLFSKDDWRADLALRLEMAQLREDLVLCTL